VFLQSLHELALALKCAALVVLDDECLYVVLLVDFDGPAQSRTQHLLSASEITLAEMNQSQSVCDTQRCRMVEHSFVQ
jgi:hypothetical protein